MRRSRSRPGGFRRSGTAGRFPAAEAGRVTTFLVAVAGFLVVFGRATGLALLVAARAPAVGLAGLLERFAPALGLGAGRFGRAFFFEEARFFAAAFRLPLAFLPARAERRGGAFFEARLGVRAAFRLAMARPFVVEAEGVPYLDSFR
jgi:hypothetical protein